MQNSIEIKYTVLFIFLIALTGFSIDSQSEQSQATEQSAASTQITTSGDTRLSK